MKGAAGPLSTNTTVGDMPSDREQELLRLAASGFSSMHVCTELGLKPTTVKWYWQRIYAKLGVNERQAAVVAARQAGWIA